MRYSDLDRFLIGFLFSCVPYEQIDKKGIIKIDDVIITRIRGIKSQFFYKGYDISACDMPEPIQRELFDKLPDILKSFYKKIRNKPDCKHPFDTDKHYEKFLSEYNYFKETGRTTWL